MGNIISEVIIFTAMLSFLECLVSYSRKPKKVKGNSGVINYYGNK